MTIEWQLTSPFDPTADVEGGDQDAGAEYVSASASASLQHEFNTVQVLQVHPLMHGADIWPPVPTSILLQI